MKHISFAFIYIINFLPCLSATNYQQKPYFMLSTPKSGTHLLHKAICLITKSKPTCIWQHSLMNSQSNIFIDGNIDKYENDPIKKTELAQKITCFPEYSGQCMFGHFNYSYLFYNYDEIHPEYVPIILIRDLRDIILSASNFWDFLEEIPTLDERIFYMLSNIEYDSVFNTKRNTEEALKWINNSNAVIIRFENLVGENGNGSLEAQKNELRKLANALSIELKEYELEDVINNLWGKTWTFRSGQVGGWKKHFTEEHKQVFKDSLGNLLIELGYENDYFW